MITTRAPDGANKSSYTMRPPSLLSPCLKQFPDFVRSFCSLHPCQILYNHIATCFTLPTFHFSGTFRNLHFKYQLVLFYCEVKLTFCVFLTFGQCPTRSRNVYHPMRCCYFAFVALQLFFWSVAIKTFYRSK